MGRLLFIGLGLYDEKDISLKGLDAIAQCDEVYIEIYTSILAGTTISELEQLYKKKVTVLSRAELENNDMILNRAKDKTVGLLTVGDPMSATTHIELRLRAFDLRLDTELIHGASIVTAAAGLLGLQQYKFGRSTTIAYPSGNYFPTSPYEILVDNLKMGLHTLLLLEIDSEKKRYMTANEGLELLLKIGSKKRNMFFSKETLACVIAHAGSKKPVVRADKVKNLLAMDFGEYLHTIVVPGKLHFKEAESLVKFAKAPNNLINDLESNQK